MITDLAQFELQKQETRLELIRNAFKLFWKEITRNTRQIYVNKKYPQDKIIVG
jgi:hypothetical protein